MKKQLLILTMVLCVLGVQATNGDGEAVNPKPTNYKEVISTIDYPQVCKEKGIEGKVIVTLKINKEGKVINHRFEEYPCSDLRDAVKDILPNLNFEPAKNAAGQSVVGLIAVPVNFKLTI
ncbi:TonB family C-terminal domain-containing protein [Ekhidna lutea]|uniref:TonB family C-terminal domain-containing protein n=1 Tax=Ekhidna lutea TaxID=447679 RepID=A0A239HUC7_EKHLU|nr:TonB family protein [Ekhidna lutea]SNS84383.1 TonB family C-terminal domain-containing protein [Ekhidna lutea]